MGRFWTRMCLVGLAALICTWAVASQAMATEATAKKPFRVVTTFTIIQDMAQNVAGDAAIVESITKPGAEIHDYEPTPLDIVKAQSADLVLWNGLNLERWFEKFLENVRDVQSVVLTRRHRADGNRRRSLHRQAESARVDVAQQRADLRREHSQGAGRSTTRPMPTTYNANAAAYTAKIEAIDEPLRQLSAIPEDQRWLVTCEGAFCYLTRDYGMKELFLWPINADEQGTPQQVRKVVDPVREVQDPGRVRESTISDKPPRRWPETGAQLWRRALRRFAERGERPGADLPRAARR